MITSQTRSWLTVDITDKMVKINMTHENSEKFKCK